jgi:hypothetical protein
MVWLFLLLIALGFIAWGKSLQTIDEVYALATYSVGLLSGVWGYTLAPGVVQLLLSVVALSCLRIGLRHP